MPFDLRVNCYRNKHSSHFDLCENKKLCSHKKKPCPDSIFSLTFIADVGFCSVKILVEKNPMRLIEL